MHDRTIQGHPWRPCGGCPHATPGACPSRRHPAYCRHVAADPGKWGPIVAAQPAETRPPRDPAAPDEGEPKEARPRGAGPAAWKAIIRWSNFIRGCPWREPCGCTKARCFRPDHAGEYVRKDDCAKCVETMVLRALPPPEENRGQA